MVLCLGQCQERIGRRGCRAQQGGGGESGSCRDWPWGQEAEGSSWADPGTLRVWCHSMGQPRGSEAAWRWAPASPSSPGRLPCSPASCISAFLGHFSLTHTRDWGRGGLGNGGGSDSTLPQHGARQGGGGEGLWKGGRVTAYTRSGGRRNLFDQVCLVLGRTPSLPLPPGAAPAAERFWVPGKLCPILLSVTAP